jgi:hypothetical protein
MAFPQFLFYSVSFLFHPKVMVWERPTHVEKVAPRASGNQKIEEETKKLSVDEIAALARRVDRKR